MHDLTHIPNTSVCISRKYRQVGMPTSHSQPRLNRSRNPNWGLLSDCEEPLFFLSGESVPEAHITSARQGFDPEFNRVVTVKSNSPTQSLHLALFCIGAWLGSAADEKDISPEMSL